MKYQYQKGMDELELRIDEQIRGGLKCGKDDRDAARVALNYYELRGSMYIPRRDAESMSDYVRRPKRSLPFTRRVVDLLCSHLYNPGPNRHFEDEAFEAWFEAVAESNLINALWQRADKYACLHGVAMFQAAATGDPANPVKVHLWTRDQFEPFTLPDDSTTVAHVVTIEAMDEQTTYKWWSPTLIRTYRTKKLGIDQTTAGQCADYIGEEPNPYGILPFSWVHNDLPVRCWHTPGLGCYLSEINGTIDDEASDMASAVKAYHTPLPIMYEGTADQQVTKGFGRFLKVNKDAGDFEGSGPRLEYLQANLDIDGGWNNIKAAILTVLEGLGVPESAYRLNQATLPSGAAQIAEQAPLMDYSKGRQEPFRKYEMDFVRMCASVDGWSPGKIDMTLSWNPATISLPGADRDMQDQDSLSMGKESLLMIVMRQFGMTEDQAKEHIKRVSEDNKFVRSLNVGPQTIDPNDPNAPQEPDSSMTQPNAGETAGQAGPDAEGYE